MTNFRRATLVLLLLAASAAASAQTSELALRVGALFPVIGRDTFDLEWDDATSPEIGLSYEFRPVRSFFVRGSIETSRLYGREIDVEAGPIATDEHTKLRLTPLRLGAGWSIPLPDDWSIWFGAGATVLFQQSEIGEDTDHRNDLGAHAFTGLRKDVDDAFFGVEGTFTYVPDALDEDPLAVLRGDEDFGGVSATLVAGWRF